MRRARSHAGMLQDDKTLSTRICGIYQPAQGCPPPSGPWEGSPLSEDPWLKKFADCVAGEPLVAARAWRMLEQKMRKEDLCSVLELLYLFTVRKETGALLIHETQRDLNVSLEAIIPAYDDLISKLSDLMNSSVALWFGYEYLAEAHRQLIEGRASADKAREVAAVWGSRAEIRYCYLLFMASQIKAATGERQMWALRSLIEAAYAAHGEKPAIPEENSLGRNILRFRERYGIKH
jgi:hypothetical protein